MVTRIFLCIHLTKELSIAQFGLAHYLIAYSSIFEMQGRKQMLHELSEKLKRNFMSIPRNFFIYQNSFYGKMLQVNVTHQMPNPNYSNF